MDRKALTLAMRECKETAQDLDVEITKMEHELQNKKGKRDAYRKLAENLEPVLNQIPRGTDGSAIAGVEMLQ